MNVEPQFEACNLSCFRKQTKLFANLSFQLKKGSVMLIEGPNGSGKSSLLRLLTGLSSPGTGEIFWGGKSIQTLQADYWQDLHYIGHANGIKLGLTVTENLQLTNVLMADTYDAPLLTVLTNLKLHTHKNSPARYLSAGQKRRLALARLFLFNKPLWILDEPFTALDSDMQTFFLAELEKHVKQGGVAIVSSHHAIQFNEIDAMKLRLDPC